ncbi:hypothetical protein EV663_103134 [Rhodovulum bhavnagarense]|uniref:Uncharacterized protein n=1 Tax=Rhodovulum bhavnagarense TaxID=992286 RepID=A0A4R2RH65_9RHOB|nr:hypothetical protein [Rhodovulum bhavnagarense]TCP61948.1 hypothetical protein EV663_103134 [Rhodovulum bhavnagarense]
MSVFAVPLALTTGYCRFWGMAARMQVQIAEQWMTLARQMNPLLPATGLHSVNDGVPEPVIEAVPRKVAPAAPDQARPAVPGPDVALVAERASDVAPVAASTPSPTDPSGGAPAPRRRARRKPAAPSQPFAD